MASQESQVMLILRSRVRKIIEAREITIKQLADDAGLTREYLSKMLGGHHDCSLVNCEKLANALGVSVLDLLTPEKNSKKSA